MVDVWADAALWTSAAALALGACIAGFTIREARLASRRQATFRYVERVTAPRIRRTIERTRAIYDVDPAEPSTSWSPYPGHVLDTRGCRRAAYDIVSIRDKLRIGELFDLYEEVSAVYLRKLLDRQVFISMVAPELVVEWRAGHWLVNYLRESDAEVIDVGVWENWQRVYLEMIERDIAYDETEDSEPDAGDYKMLPEVLPLLWPNRIRWEGFGPRD